MKQQKAMLIALIVICLTVIVTALVTRKDLCEVRIRTGQAGVTVVTAYESERDETWRGWIPAALRVSGILNAPFPLQIKKLPKEL
ncbi:MAG: Hok/gef family protein [Bacteriophage sp.]|nr:MAG: Hok/gef family protein [Bacteriophage sp.]